MTTQVYIIKPGTLSDADKKKLEDSGNMVIEHPYPNDVRVITTDIKKQIKKCYTK